AVGGPPGSSSSPIPSASPSGGPVPVLTWPGPSASPTPAGRTTGQRAAGDVPQLSVSLPTASPSATTTAVADTQQATAGDLTRTGALLGGAFGMALIAGYLAWRGRRLRPDPDLPSEEATADDGPGDGVIGPVELVPRLAVVPPSTLGAHEAQRILP